MPAQLTSAAALAKATLFAGMTTFWATAEPAVLATYGWPTVGYPPEVAAFLDVTSEQAPGPLSSSNRSRDETLRLEFGISVFIAGGDGTPEDASRLQKVAEDRAYKLAGDVETYVRKTNTTLGGAVLWAFLTEIKVASFPTIEEETDGLVCELTGTVESRARISG